MKVAIVEDEYLLADELEDMLYQIVPDVNVVAKLDSISSSVQWLQENSCDLIFLDVHLSDGLSFSIFEEVEVKTPIIFTTAFDSYSIKAFEYNSISYLLKPIQQDLLAKAIGKYKGLVPEDVNTSALLEYLRNNIPETPVSYKKRFILEMGLVQKPVDISSIAYFMADDKHLFAFTTDGKKYFYDSTLAKLALELNPKIFFRLNRKFFVHVNSIKELRPYSKSRIKVKLEPEPSEDVIISYARANDFKKWLNE